MVHTPIRYLSAPMGKLLEPPKSSKPILADGYLLRPGFIAMVREQPFSGFKFENSYHHLQEFEKLCSCLCIPGIAQETLRWILFPFSLKEGAEKWYTINKGKVDGDWEKLWEKFCIVFFPIDHIAFLHRQLLNFHQLEKESIGAAWARFTCLTHEGRNLSLPDHVLLQHFCGD